MIRIQTDRITISPFLMEDMQDLQEIFGDSETMKNCEPAYDIAKTEDFLRNFCIERGGALAAELKENGKVVGYILFKEYEKDVYEAGWIFNRGYWRRGLAFEAMKAVFSYAFERLNAHKVFAEAIDPVKSVGLMEKLGMKREGIQRSQTRDNDGNWADMYFYGLLAEDWRK